MQEALAQAQRRSNERLNSEIGITEDQLGEEGATYVEDAWLRNGAPEDMEDSAIWQIMEGLAEEEATDEPRQERAEGLSVL